MPRSAPRRYVLLRILADAALPSRAIPATPGILLLSSTIGRAREARQASPLQVGPEKRLLIPPTAHYNRPQRTRAANQTP
jgi:hypothetical protein